MSKTVTRTYPIPTGITVEVSRLEYVLPETPYMVDILDGAGECAIGVLQGNFATEDEAFAAGWEYVEKTLLPTLSAPVF